MSVRDTLTFALACPDISAWRTGNTGTPGIWQFDSGVAGRHVMISALVHGNELCGAWALKGLLEAGVRPQQGALTLALCNLAAFDRFDPANPDASRLVEEDLNRQWLVERMAAADTRGVAPVHCALLSSRPTGCWTCIRCMNPRRRCC